VKIETFTSLEFLECFIELLNHQNHILSSSLSNLSISLVLQVVYLLFERVYIVIFFVNTHGKRVVSPAREIKGKVSLRVN
jgi:hypothetical protein